MVRFEERLKSWTPLEEHLKVNYSFFLRIAPIYHTLPYPILSYPILSYPILSYPILSYQLVPRNKGLVRRNE